ncbi:hypothetical protein [Flavobacterium sp. JP2137]|uniref:hypothetical protein n=1 Tax=Flavobacterium sp. JP2137 TaxID=3414510 RepID=UPI003D2FF034
MKTKQEVIREAWGLLFDELPISAKHIAIRNDGFISQYFKSRFDNSGIEFENTYSYGNEFRPKSLQGIENNEGWISIKSEEDLPKETGCYHVINKKGRYFRKNYLLHMKNNKENWRNITHYQPITKPNLPLHE